MTYSPTSVFGHFVQFQRGLPNVRHDLVVDFLQRRGWLNGSVNLGAYIGEKFQPMDAPSVAKYMRTHDWVARVLDAADEKDGLIDETNFCSFLPHAYLRSSEVSPWMIAAGFKLFHWYYTVESETSFTLVLEDSRCYPRDLRKYLPPDNRPPDQLRWKIFLRCTQPALQQKVRQEYLLRYLPLVRSIAINMATGFPRSVELSELISIGTIGLIDAFNRYDPSTAQFSTFAVPRIRGSILDELRSIDWVPRSVRKFSRDYEAALIKLTHELGSRLPTMQELATKLELSYDKLITHLFWSSQADIQSLDDPVFETDGGSEVTRVELIESADPTPLAVVSYRELVHALQESMKQLSAQEQLVLTLYYWHDVPLRLIGQRLHISESRVSQVKTRATSRLRSILCQRFNITNPADWYQECLLTS